MPRQKVATALLVAALGAGGLSACTTAGTGPAPAAPAAAPAKAAEAPRTIHPADAAILASNCFACHGPDGHSPGTMPSLDRLKKNRLVSDMQDFRGGAPSTVMGRHAKGYTDAEIEAIADYISGLRKK